MSLQSQNQAILTISCPDTHGITAAVTSLLAATGANITYIDQQVDYLHQLFFMRVSWDLSTETLPLAQFKERFHKEVALLFSMEWDLSESSSPQRMALFVSKHGHCLFDILGRIKSGNLEVEVPLVISNHEKYRHEVERLGIDFYHIPVTAENREEQVATQLALLTQYTIDFVCLARYMQIIPPSFIEAFPNRIINIHHSFLPGFPGAKPYHQAYERGVKLIGATGHYVTADLDAGPIIEQDVQRVSLSPRVEDLVKMGQDIEMRVLARAIRFHLEKKVLSYSNRTVIFR